MKYRWVPVPESELSPRGRSRRRWIWRKAEGVKFRLSPVGGGRRSVRRPETMARIARIVVPGCAYHVTHRGNRRGEIFPRDGDQDLYEALLREYAHRHELEIWAYCWMPNHVHLVVVAHRTDSLSRAIGVAHRRYSRSINRRNDWTGHLWANRFYSTPLDSAHLLLAVRYVELNPVRAGLTRTAEEYAWSSARAHTLGSVDTLLSARSPFPGAIGDWSAWLRQGLEDDELELLRERTRTGRPCGAPGFVRELEQRSGRRLRRLAPGRSGLDGSPAPAADRPGDGSREGSGDS